MYLGRFCGVALLVMAGSAGAQEEWTPSDCEGLARNSVEAAILNCHGEVADPAVAALLGQDPLREAPFSSAQPFVGKGREAVGNLDSTRAPTIVDVLGAAPAARAGPLVQIDAEYWATEQQRARSSADHAAEPAAREGLGRGLPRLVPLTPTAEPHVEIDGQVVSAGEWLEGRLTDRLTEPAQVEMPVEDLAARLPPSTEAMRSAVIDGVTVELDQVSYKLLELILRSTGAGDIEEVPAVQPEVLRELRE